MNEQTRQQLLEKLRLSIPKKQIHENVPMSRFTTLRLGGPADVLAQPSTVEEIAASLSAAAALDVPVTIIGKGSNVLVRDGGVRGLVLHIGEHFARISDPVPLPDGRSAITAQGGAALIALANAAAEHGLQGLEFAGGIPGTVGGGVYMNAGAYGGEMKDVVTCVTAIAPDGRTIAYTGEEMQFGYRHSVLMDSAQPMIVTSVTVALRPGDADTIRAAMREFNARRREKQPITLPSCGSTFKRPEGQFAGTLIDQCGLKGLRVGGASVSTLHAGFLVNDQEGTAADYLALIAQVQRVVLEKTGVALECEVRVIGEDAPAVVEVFR